MAPEHAPRDAESQRLAEDTARTHNWKRWGPYLAERQWGTVREDYSATGDAWSYFPHDHAPLRAYRWGEDGLLGLCDREGRLCFGLALWNGADAILKERLFGLAGPEGNHGEDVKESYFYLASTPTHSYMKALYKYPQQAFPYEHLRAENARRGAHDPEFELEDTGIFDGDRYFDVVAEYAKNGPDDVLIQITIANRGDHAARCDVLPTLWFRNTWSWGREGEGYWPRPSLEAARAGLIAAHHASLGAFALAAAPASDGTAPAMLFTGNETNAQTLYGTANPSPYVKDAFHRYIVHGQRDAVDPAQRGTKAAFHYALTIPARGEVTLRVRLHADAAAPANLFGPGFDQILAQRIAEHEAFYARVLPAAMTEDERRVAVQGYAGLLWSKQFYHYDVASWLDGDPVVPSPDARRGARNSDWRHLYNRDVLSMPDAWEYPWYAAWDLAFHMVPFARIDLTFAKQQLELVLREWYMHPNGQIPAYEWTFSDVNPPVHAWACWRVYKMSGPKGARDRAFLERCFHKLLLNFTWWINRKDLDGNHIFAGGFLGLDNIGVFDRSKPLPTGGHLEQADGTAWMAFYSATMLSIALELARENPAYDSLASKFFEHFTAISRAMNTFGGSGLWDDADGFYYDRLHSPSGTQPLRIRSMVGLIPLIACEVLEQDVIDALPKFRKRMEWFLANRPAEAAQIACMDGRGGERRLLAIPSRERLRRLLGYMLDESEFLSPFGLRSLSRVHRDAPFTLAVDGTTYQVAYDPAESTSGLFGGNSNWRGPVWFPLNYLLIESLERYHHFYGDTFQVECPSGSGVWMTLDQVARELSRRMTRLFLSDDGRRACHGEDARFASDPHWRDLVLFHEYFHGDTGRGIGASHQTGWTALVLRFLEDHARQRTPEPAGKRTARGVYGGTSGGGRRASSSGA